METTQVMCPDCGMKTSHLVSSTGTCKLCYKRFHNMKSRGQEYIKLKDIKDTKEYNRAMGRRLAALSRHESLEKEKSKKKIKKDTEKRPCPKSPVISDLIEGYDYIEVDHTRLLSAIDYLKYCLDKVPEIEKQVVKLQEDMLVITHKKAETKGPGDKEFDELNAREYRIICYRRKLKDLLAYVKLINKDILNDSLMDSIENTRRVYEKDEYVPKYARGDAKCYTVSVNVSGLNGISQIQSFKRKVYARDENGAKSYVENFLKGLNGVTIFGKTWFIREVQE